VHDEGKSVRRIFARGSNLGVRVFALAVLMLGLVGGLVAGTHKSNADTLTAIEPAAVAATEAPSALPAAIEERRVERDAKLYVSEVKQSAAAHAFAVAQAKKKAAAERKAAAKAAAEAKAKAQAEAVRRLAAERASRSSSRAAVQSSSGPSGESAPAVPVDCASYSGNRQTACSLLDWAGFGSSQMSCLEPLWERESGWRVSAQNSGSGAYGIPQALPGRKMAAYGSDWQTNAVPQIKWGLMYIKGRYGDPCGAWSAFQSKGWY
jgi:hypothetical protein